MQSFKTFEAVELLVYIHIHVEAIDNFYALWTLHMTFHARTVKLN